MELVCSHSVCSTTHQTAWRLGLNSDTSAAHYCSSTVQRWGQNQMKKNKWNLHKVTLRWNVLADGSQWIKITPSIFFYFLTFSVALNLVESRILCVYVLIIKCSDMENRHLPPVSFWASSSLLYFSFLILSFPTFSFFMIQRKSIHPASTFQQQLINSVRVKVGWS